MNCQHVHARPLSLGLTLYQCNLSRNILRFRRRQAVRAPPSIVVQDELTAEADENLFGDLDAGSEWDLSASGEPAESDMGSASGNPSSHIKPPTFSGGKFRDSGRALLFLEDITLYFEVFQFFSPESERDEWLRRSALLRMTCFPEGSYARTWFSSQFANILTFEQVVREFKEQFVSSTVDLVTVQSQWSAAKQRKGDSVAQYYQHLLGLESLLGQLGHIVSDNEAITKFLDGLSDSLRNRLVLRRIENQSLTRQALVNLAVALETGDRTTRASTAASSVALNAFQTKHNKSQQRCWFCKRTDHTADTCKKILARKAAGTWEDRSKKSKPQ